ncbi:MAG: decaprenyl-phosphate phosphoribosyltransferase [Flavihumibacter sp.]
MIYLKMLRVHHWVKNLFLFIPLFFAGELFVQEKLLMVIAGFFPFCLCASAIYVLNDLKDLPFDRIHPVKAKRPIASGAVSKPAAITIATICMVAGLATAYFLKPKFFFVLALYVVLNIMYSLKLKQVSILDVFILSIGFVLRIKAGGVLAQIGISQWLMIMVFLLALFMAVAKRRDDVLIKETSHQVVRKASEGYQLDFLNTMLSVIVSVIMVSYIMYCISAETMIRFHTHRLYYTSLFVLAGLFRYLQIVYVQRDSGSPTRLLYRDRFIQVTILLWIVSFYLIIYFPDKTFFE